MCVCRFVATFALIRRPFLISAHNFFHCSARVTAASYHPYGIRILSAYAMHVVFVLNACCSIGSIVGAVVVRVGAVSSVYRVSFHMPTKKCASIFLILRPHCPFALSLLGQNQSCMRLCGIIYQS